eukprot:scaffold23471_cov141-Cylindrotheca_fusiformis.AAC.10
MESVLQGSTASPNKGGCGAQISDTSHGASSTVADTRRQVVKQADERASSVLIRLISFSQSHRITKPVSKENRPRRRRKALMPSRKLSISSSLTTTGVIGVTSWLLLLLLLLLSGENQVESFSTIPTSFSRTPESSSILSSSCSIAKPKQVTNGWNAFCPPFWPTATKKPTDVTITWNRTADDDNDDAWLLAENAANRMLHQLDPNVRPNSETIQALSTYLFEFSNFCLGQFSSRPRYHFKARILATRGPSGTKCPQWHMDHVPVRWVQALVGPGCEVVRTAPETTTTTTEAADGIHWEVMNALDLPSDVSMQDRNRALVDETVAQIYSVKEQEVALLAGTRWNEFCKEEKKDHHPIKPAVHRSPKIPMWQSRLLLTQDVIFD